MVNPDDMMDLGLKMFAAMPIMLALVVVFSMIFSGGSGSNDTPAPNLREEQERRIGRWRVLADDELRERNAFDEWLGDALLRAEIDHAANPDDSGLHSSLEQLKAVKSENNGRIVWLTSRANHEPVQEGTVSAVRKQWDELRKHAIPDQSA
ncbi:TPA: hypothetical protein ACK3Q6_007666 [Burkholderia cepacia]